MKSTSESLREIIDNLDVNRIAIRRGGERGRDGKWFHHTPVEYVGADPFLQKCKKELKTMINWDDPQMVALFTPLVEEIIFHYEKIQDIVINKKPNMNSIDVINQFRALIKIQPLLSQAAQFKEKYVNHEVSEVQQNVVEILTNNIEELEAQKKSIMEYLQHYTEIEVLLWQKDPREDLKKQLNFLDNKINDLEAKIETIENTLPNTPRPKLG